MLNELEDGKKDRNRKRWMLLPHRQKRLAASKKKLFTFYVLTEKKQQIFSATRTCLAKMAKCLSKKPKLLTKWIETLLATLDTHPLETENKKTEWKFRQNIIKRNKKKNQNKLKFSQCLLCCLTLSRWKYNCGIACAPGSIWQVFFRRVVHCAAGQSTLSTVTRLHLYSPSSVSFKKNNDLLYIILLYF